MNESNVQTLHTTDELLAMPDDDGVDRYLVRGELREDRGNDMTKRNADHSTTTTNTARLLANWNKHQPLPRGRVLTGEAACRIRKSPDTTYGVDLMYIDAALANKTPRGAPFVDGVPTLVIEILSPSDKQERIVEKVQEYLQAGVPLVWIMDPWFFTVTVHRKDAPPQMFSTQQQISGDPYLPGFVATASEFFEM